MSGDQIALAAQEAGFRIRTRRAGYVQALHPEADVVLRAELLPAGEWRVTACGPARLGQVDTRPTDAAALIALLSGCFGRQARDGRGAR